MAAKKRYKFKKGDKVRIIGLSGGHNIPIDTICTVAGPISGGYRVLEFGQWYVPTADMELIPCTFTRPSVEAEIQVLQAQIDVLNGKLAYLDETGLETGCEKEFKIFQTLALVENGNLNKQQKAKAIAGLLEND